MATHRLNITLPRSEYARLRAKPNKSAFIAEAVREKLDAEDRNRRQAALENAYREAAERSAELASDWDSTVTDGL